MRLSQTSIIAASLVIAFVVFITVRGELPAYLSIFGVGSGSTPAGSSGSAGVTSGGPGINLVISGGGGGGSDPFATYRTSPIYGEFPGNDPFNWFWNQQ